MTPFKKMYVIDPDVVDDVVVHDIVTFVPATMVASKGLTDRLGF